MPAFLPATLLPVWAETPTGPENTPVDPGAPLSAKGWDAGNRVAAQHLNYLLYWITSWITYLGYYVYTTHLHLTGNDLGAPDGFWLREQTPLYTAWSCLNGDTGSLICAIPAKRGTVITQVQVHVASSNATNTDINARLEYYTFPSGTGTAAPSSLTTIVAATNMPASNANAQTITLTVAGSGHEVAQNEFIHVRILAAQVTGTKRCFGVTVTMLSP